MHRQGGLRVAALLALATLVLAGCGGAGGSCPPGAANSAIMFGVPTLQDEGNYWGLTEYGCGSRPTVVKISFEAPDALLDRVVAHEMLHVCGLVQHEASPACYLHSTIYSGQSVVPCASEVDRLTTITDSYEIRVTARYLVEHAQAAAEMWNEYAGREVFTVVDDAPPSDDV